MANTPAPPRRAFRRRTLVGACVLVGAAALASLWIAGRARAPALTLEAALKLRDGGGTTQSSLCTAANAVGVGLEGVYFEGERFGGRELFRRLDATIDFASPADLAPPAGVGAARSVRWKGWIKAPMPGAYRFHAASPGLSIRVANQVAAADGEPAAALQMAAGRFYPIQVELAAASAPTGPVRLEWTAPHGARYLVPKALLFAPTDSVAGPRT